MSSRNKSIDVLRGGAILLVLGRHYPHCYYYWTAIGEIGVDLFFVLSGFLISGLLFSEFKRTGSIDFWRFFIRRGFKIYPAYFVLLLACAPFILHRIGWTDFLFFQSYRSGVFGHAWSLSVEEHFYVLLPLLLIVGIKIAPRSEFKWIPGAFLVIVVGCLAAREAGGVEMMVRTHARCDSLFCGVFLGWLYHFQTLAIRRKNLLLLALPLALSILVFDRLTYVRWGLLANAVAFTALTVWAINTPWLGVLVPLRRIGVYSYSIYLWHWPIAQLFQDFIKRGQVGFWLYVLTSIAVGIAMTKAIEAPVLRYRDKCFPHRISTPAAIKSPSSCSGRSQSMAV